MFKNNSAMKSLVLIPVISVMILSFILSCKNSDVRRNSFPEQTYISYLLPYEKYHGLLKRLENKLGRKLRNRSEAHITIITPPEYVILKQVIPEDEFKHMTNEFLIAKPQYKEICLGIGVAKNNPELKTYYLVVDSKDMFAFRHKLAQVAKLSKSQFNSDDFYPHITLGFTDRDLHQQDGVLKTKDTCSKDLQDLLN